MTSHHHTLKSKVKKFEHKLGAQSDTENLMDLYNEILDRSRGLPIKQKLMEKEQENAGKRSRRKVTNKTR